MKKVFRFTLIFSLIFATVQLLAGDISSYKQNFANFRPVLEEMQKAGVAFADYHVHVTDGGKMTPEGVREFQKFTGIPLGMLENVGRGWSLDSNEKISAFIDAAEKEAYRENPNRKAFLIGIQVNDRDWYRVISEENRKRLDYILADTLVMVNPDGSPAPLWEMPSDYSEEDAETWMKRYFAHCCTVLSEPITIWADPTFLPDFCADQYDKLWTNERLATLIDLCVKNQIAIEVQSSSKFATERFFRMALERGAKLVFGSNNYDDQPKSTERWTAIWRNLQPKKSQILYLTQICAAAIPFIQNGSVPGLVSIISDGGKLQIDCVGWADVENRVPMTENSLMWIASQTKGVTGVAFMTLVDQGKVALDDPVSKYLPEFADVKVGVKNEDGTMTLRAPARPMTLRHVLTHTAGFPFLTPQMSQFGIDVFPMRQLASTAASQPLNSDPGTEYKYSNVGIDVAAAVIEVVSGKPFAVYLQETIFDPLGMTDTTFYPTPDQLKRLAKCYRLENGKCVEVPVPFLQRPYDSVSRFPEGGGGLFSTPVDFMKFYQMLAANGVGNGKRILSEEAMRILRTKQTPEGVPNGYSLGLNTNGDWFGHGGALQTNSMANAVTNQAWGFFVQVQGQNPAAGPVAEARNKMLK